MFLIAYNFLNIYYMLLLVKNDKCNAQKKKTYFKHIVSMVYNKLHLRNNLAYIIPIYVLLIYTISAVSCQTNKIEMNNEAGLTFDVLGHINNMEIVNSIIPNDSLEVKFESNYIVWGADFRNSRISPKSNYLIVRVNNVSNYNCHCGIGFDGSLTTLPFVMTDSLYFKSISELSLNGSIGTDKVELVSDYFATIPAKSSRIFLALEPLKVRSSKNIFNMGYYHYCQLLDKNNIPIDSLDLKDHFVSEYYGETLYEESGD